MGLSSFNKDGVISEQILDANEFYAKMAFGQAKWDLVREGYVKKAFQSVGY